MSESIQCYQCGTSFTLAELVKNQDDCPECGAQHSLKDVANALELNAGAQSAPEPVQCEAVEVVATLEIGDYNDESSIYARLAPGHTLTIDKACDCDRLMTVAQHHRLMAAAKPDADLVERLEIAARTMSAVLAQEPKLKAVARRVLAMEVARIDAALAKLTEQNQ